MCGTHHIRPSSMNGAMNEECSFIEYFHAAVVENVAVVVDAQEIGFIDEVEVNAEGY